MIGLFCSTRHIHLTWTKRLLPFLIKTQWGGYFIEWKPDSSFCWKVFHIKTYRNLSMNCLINGSKSFNLNAKYKIEKNEWNYFLMFGRIKLIPKEKNYLWLNLLSLIPVVGNRALVKAKIFNTALHGDLSDFIKCFSYHPISPLLAWCGLVSNLK